MNLAKPCSATLHSRILVQKRVIRGFGEDLVEGREPPHQRGPQDAVVLVAEQVRLRTGRKPRVPFEFIFKLAGPPTRIAEEGPHDATGAACVFERGWREEAQLNLRRASSAARSS